MDETYCGKNCGECEHKEAMNCAGCKAGPGSRGGDCELAQCCVGKGHESCQTCIFLGNCGTLRGRESMPETRSRKQELEAARKAEMARKAPLLGKWLWIFFWLVIPRIIANAMTNETITAAVPALAVLGTILLAVCNLAGGIILLQLAPITRRYRIAGWCCIAVAVADPIIAQFGEDSLLLLVPMIVVLIVTFVSEYQTFHGHAEALDGVDAEMAEKWRKLWRWYIGLLIGVIVGFGLALLIPTLGILVMLAILIAVIVVGVLQLVYLYRTAKLFREYHV